MKLKNITENDIEYIRKIYWNRDLSWDERMKLLMDFTEKSERTVRKWCSEKLNIKEKIEIIPEQIKIAKTKKHDKTKKYYIISSAQNATSINLNLWKNILKYANFLDAEIIIIPFRYHNPTSINFNKDDEWWDKNLSEYLSLNRAVLNKSIQVLGDVKIQPTAFSPLLGLEGMTGDYSCVVGHPKMELKTIPVLDETKPKLMFTTGSVTKPNFSDTKAGKKGQFHFSSGFAIVEIKDDNTYFFRQVSAKENGEFIDLYFNVKNEEISINKDVDALIMGDIHVENVNNEIIDKTINGLCEKLYPKNVFIHDVMDSHSVSHHSLKDPFLQAKMELDGTNSLADEMSHMIQWLKQIDDLKTNVYIVKSNHDEHVDRFLKEADWRKMSTFKNALPYMEYATAILKNEAPNGIVPYVINKHYPNFKCLTYNDSISINGYLCSMHGSIGASGTKGSITQFSKLSVKNVIGHTHSVARISGSCSVGTSTNLRLNYNKGLTTWINAHGIINKLGKFQHIIFFKTKDGFEYTTFDSLINDVENNSDIEQNTEFTNNKSNVDYTKNDVILYSEYIAKKLGEIINNFQEISVYKFDQVNFSKMKNVCDKTITDFKNIFEFLDYIFSYVEKLNNYYNYLDSFYLKHNNIELTKYEYNLESLNYISDEIYCESISYLKYIQEYINKAKYYIDLEKFV